MRSINDPLLSPGASKDAALALIRSGWKRKAYASLRRLAKEALERYFLSPEEKLLVSISLHASAHTPDDLDQATALWRLAARPLARKGNIVLISDYALMLVESFLERRDAVQTKEALMEARRFVQHLPAYSSTSLHYASCVDQYLRLSNDVEGANALRLG